MNPVRRLWLVLLAVGAVAAEPATRRYPVAPEAIRPEQGHCYIAVMDFGEDGDKETGGQSGLLLYEDGVLLGPARALHRDIREQGAGRYSHWTAGALYFSASDNSDPRVNQRTYEVASTNPLSALGGLGDLPSTTGRHTEIVTAQQQRYTITMGGRLDAENTLTLATASCTIGYQPNLQLTIANVGSEPVVAPRLVINQRGDWYDLAGMVAEFTRGATSDGDRAYLIWQAMREHLYHQMPTYPGDEPHDPVRLLGCFGWNLCDDAGAAGNALFVAAGLEGSVNRALNGHVQCEALVDGEFWFMDVDMDCFYLDRENERPVGGDVLARDHDLARRELNYGPVVDRFQPSVMPAGLFGPDDRQFRQAVSGHSLDHTLRPGERLELRWDNRGKYPAASAKWDHRPPFFGNSRLVYTPELSAAAMARDAVEVVGWQGARSVEPIAVLTYAMRSGYILVGGSARLELDLPAGAGAAVAASLDGQEWTRLWATDQAGRQVVELDLDSFLQVRRGPARYGYRLRLETTGRGVELAALTLDCDLLTAPLALPRLRLGDNDLVYTDQSTGSRRVEITHQWRETVAWTPPPAPGPPVSPAPGEEVARTLVEYRWPSVDGAARYHLQVSRRADFAWPYRTSLDVIVPRHEYVVPIAGIYSPDQTYHLRLRARDRRGVWSEWSQPTTFTWRGPRVPVDLRLNPDSDGWRLSWSANPRGERPVAYRVHASDEQGFTPSDEPSRVPDLGELPASFVSQVEGTSLRVPWSRPGERTEHRAFYRVVAVDAAGVESGPSEAVALPRPLIVSQAVATATVGQPYRYQLQTVRSLGDLQARADPTAATRQYLYRYWAVEQPRWTKLTGPAWLILDAATGLLAGQPPAEAVGQHPVLVQVAVTGREPAVQAWTLTVSR